MKSKLFPVTNIVRDVEVNDVVLEKGKDGRYLRVIAIGKNDLHPRHIVLYLSPHQDVIEDPTPETYWMLMENNLLDYFKYVN